VTSCDAALILPYKVLKQHKNGFKDQDKRCPIWQTIYSSKIDTILTLRPNETVMVGFSNSNGFPWETKKLYRKHPGLQNFWLIGQDTNLIINNSDQNWKYKKRSSIFKIE
jgi:hypothetical protein